MTANGNVVTPLLTLTHDEIITFHFAQLKQDSFSYEVMTTGQYVSGRCSTAEMDSFLHKVRENSFIAVFEPILGPRK